MNKKKITLKKYNQWYNSFISKFKRYAPVTNRNTKYMDWLKHYMKKIKTIERGD